MTREGYKKHKDLIDAWANGAEVEYYKNDRIWTKTKEPLWNAETMYRITPKKIEFKDCSFNDIEYRVNGASEITSYNPNDFGLEYSKQAFKDKKIAEAYAVLPQLIRLRDEYNKGWEPDWENDNFKEVIINRSNKITEMPITNNTRILVFKTKEIRNRFLKDHKDLIEIAKPLL